MALGCHDCVYIVPSEMITTKHTHFTPTGGRGGVCEGSCASLYICLDEQNLAAAFKLVLNAYPFFLASR